MTFKDKHPELMLGDVGDAVVHLQALLGDVQNAVFSTSTEYLVRSKQRTEDLEPTGVVDEQLWSRLHPTIRYGDEGSFVTEVQEELGVETTGRVESDTVKAVVYFQLDHNITADGICGPNTYLSMLR